MSYRSACLQACPKGAPSDMVLAGVDGQKLSVYTERLFRKLGIADASFHSLRHTAASWLVMRGEDLYASGNCSAIEPHEGRSGTPISLRDIWRAR